MNWGREGALGSGSGLAACGPSCSWAACRAGGQHSQKSERATLVLPGFQFFF